MVHKIVSSIQGQYPLFVFKLFICYLFVSKLIYIFLNFKIYFLFFLFFYNFFDKGKKRLVSGNLGIAPPYLVNLGLVSVRFCFGSVLLWFGLFEDGVAITTYIENKLLKYFNLLKKSY